MESRDRSNSSDTVEAVHRVREEIAKLTEQHSEALRMATYVGMTPNEANVIDERRARILSLVHELAVLEDPSKR
jgi:hypothetical protein